MPLNEVLGQYENKCLPQYLASMPTRNTKNYINEIPNYSLSQESDHTQRQSDSGLSQESGPAKGRTSDLPPNQDFDGGSQDVIMTEVHNGSEDEEMKGDLRIGFTEKKIGSFGGLFDGNEGDGARERDWW